MKKLRSKAGFTLIEMMAVVLILVVLMMGIGKTMDAGMQIYRDATFEADSAALAGILNTSIGDILRYSQDILENTGTFEDASGDLIVKERVAFVFTNLEYGIQDAYFYTPIQEGGVSRGVLQMKNLRNADIVELVNTGAYPDLVISNFKITYVAKGATVLNASGASIESRGDYFHVTYEIFSESNDQLKRNVETIIRRLNG